MELEAKKAELKRVQSTWLYAFAMGAGCGYSPNEDNYREVRKYCDRLSEDIAFEQLRQDLDDWNQSELDHRQEGSHKSL